MATDASIQRAAPPALGLSNVGRPLAGLAATAGVIHVVATIEHITETWTLWAFFALVGAAQLFVGWRIYRGGEDRRLLKAAALGSVVVAVLWLFSRTTGLPFGPYAGRVSSVGVADTIATLQALAFAALAAVVIWRPKRDGQPLPWLGSALGIRLTFAILSMTLFMAALGGHEH